MTTPGSLTWAVNRLLAVSNASPLRSVFLPQVCFASVGTACPPAYSVSYAGNQENVDFVTHSVQVHTQPVLFFFFLPHREACGFLLPCPGIKPMSPAVEAWSPNHWTAREVPTPLGLLSASPAPPCPSNPSAFSLQQHWPDRSSNPANYF